MSDVFLLAAIYMVAKAGLWAVRYVRAKRVLGKTDGSRLIEHASLGNLVVFAGRNGTIYVDNDRVWCQGRDVTVAASGLLVSARRHYYRQATGER